MATPSIHPTAHVCKGAQIIGQVTISARCFIGPNAVLRGDIEPLFVDVGSNVQDCCVLHTHAGNPVHIGKNVSIGHGAVVHGATIEDHALIGMNAVVLDKAVVGERSVIGALTLVPNGFAVPPRSLAVGSPCRIVKEDDPRIADMAEQNGLRYQDYLDAHAANKWDYA